jgi:transcriptional regulator of acetoin/glycerol metabolism
MRTTKSRSLAVIACLAGVEGPGGLILASVERAHVYAVLKACEWDRSLAAWALGLHRRTLQRKLKGYARSGRPARPRLVKVKKVVRRRVARAG